MNFKLVDEDAFETLQDARPVVTTAVVAWDFCPACNIKMMNDDNGMSCSICGLVAQSVSKQHDVIDAGRIKRSTGSKKGKIFTMSGNNTEATQKKNIRGQLQIYADAYKGAPIPPDILTSVTNQYIDIQKKVTNRENIIKIEKGEPRGRKQFIHRGNLKDEILATLISYECVRRGCTRKSADIALFMQLQTAGFSDGEKEIRQLAADGIIELPTDENEIDGFIYRYMARLMLPEELHNNCRNFVTDIVNLSDQYNIDISSQPVTKIAGCLWAYVSYKHIKYSLDQLEAATDNTKRNTFMKFFIKIVSNMNIFRIVFEKHNVPSSM